MSLLTKGVTTLSDLGIDVNKDWGGHRIENIGGEKEHALTAAEMPAHTHPYGCAVVVAAAGDMAGEKEQRMGIERLSLLVGVRLAKTGRRIMPCVS